MVPKFAFPPGMEFTSQVTAGLLAFCTFALNCSVLEAATWVAGAETVTVAAGGAGAGGGSPPAVAAQETRTSGASNTPSKEKTHLHRAGVRRRPGKRDDSAVSKGIVGIAARPAETVRGERTPGRAERSLYLLAERGQ
jgi:hypothetical protein